MTGLEFRAQLDKFRKDRDELVRKENDLKMGVQLHNEKFQAFMKECGLPDNFSFEELAQLAIRKANEP